MFELLPSNDITFFPPISFFCIHQKQISNLNKFSPKARTTAKLLREMVANEIICRRSPDANSSGSGECFKEQSFDKLLCCEAFGVHTKLPPPEVVYMGSENTPEGPFTVQREIYDPLQDIFFLLWKCAFRINNKEPSKNRWLVKNEGWKKVYWIANKLESNASCFSQMDGWWLWSGSLGRAGRKVDLGLKAKTKTTVLGQLQKRQRRTDLDIVFLDAPLLDRLSRRDIYTQM